MSSDHLNKQLQVRIKKWGFEFGSLEATSLFFILLCLQWSEKVEIKSNNEENVS